MGHRNDILDDELATPERRASELIWLWALFATIISAGFYMIPLLVIFPDFNQKASPKVEFLSGLFSILHLIMAMAMMNEFVNKKYEKLLKGGYYILLFGSGIFFIGAVLTITNIAPKVLPFPNDEAELSFWGENYEAIIILFIIFLKFLLIKPLTRFLAKK